MARTALFAIAVLSAALVSAPALACNCKKGEGAAKAKVQKAKPAKESCEAAQGASDAVDQALAGKCSCESPSDCTCKKGDCKCPKCNGGVQRVRMIESLKGERTPLVIPDSARRDATAGIFI